MAHRQEMPGRTERDGRAARRTMALWTASTVLALAAIGLYAWLSLKGLDIGVNGYLALALGAAGAVALGLSLSALLVYSHRHGYDEHVGELPEDRE